MNRAALNVVPGRTKQATQAAHLFMTPKRGKTTRRGLGCGWFSRRWKPSRRTGSREESSGGEAFDLPLNGIRSKPDNEENPGLQHSILEV